MKTSLEHLLESKREGLEIITEVIKQRVKPEMIILFGSHARGDWGMIPMWKTAKRAQKAGVGETRLNRKILDE